jgi:transcriptional regulator with XRE-family HTH domain
VRPLPPHKREAIASGHPSCVQESRAGNVLRSVRRRRGLRQVDLAELAGVSQQTVSLFERGLTDYLSFRTLKRIAAALGITVDLALRWKGPELERLTDARHARLVKAVLSRIGPEWKAVVEYTFNDFGDRGSVDVVAWHAAAQALLLIEVKSELVSLEAVLRSMDVKIRVVPRLLERDRRWQARIVGSVMVLPDESRSRRAVESLATVFDIALPSRTVAVRRWLGRPLGPIRGIWFLADTNTRRVVRNSGSAGRVSRPEVPRIHAQERAAADSPGEFKARSDAESASSTPVMRG